MYYHPTFSCPIMSRALDRWAGKPRGTEAEVAVAAVVVAVLIVAAAVPVVVEDLERKTNRKLKKNDWINK